jgi:ribosomal protein S18 acetylase RimI-like enzyme
MSLVVIRMHRRQQAMIRGCCACSGGLGAVSSFSPSFGEWVSSDTQPLQAFICWTFGTSSGESMMVGWIEYPMSHAQTMSMRKVRSRKVTKARTIAKMGSLCQDHAGGWCSTTTSGESHLIASQYGHNSSSRSGYEHICQSVCTSSSLKESMAGPTSFTIVPVRSALDLSAAVDLFYSYAKSLGIDLSFQSFDTEMAVMPGKYSPPTGELLLARNDHGQAIGCAALRPLRLPEICEIKRLYVAPSGRGTGVGKALARKIIEVARDSGYGEMRLDTLPTMTAALALYRSLGFVDIPAYYDTPLSGTRFLSLDLRTSATAP